MRGVAISATDVVSPMLTASEVVVLFSAGMTDKAGFRNCFGSHGFERSHLGRITLFNVSLAGPMTRFASGYLSFPTANCCQLGMRSMRKGFELIFVTVLAGFATYVVPSLVRRFLSWIGLGGLRRGAGGQPGESADNQTADQKHSDKFVRRHLCVLSLLFADAQERLTQDRPGFCPAVFSSYLRSTAAHLNG